MYPAPQAVTTIARAVGNRLGPYTCPTTEGIVEKKPPLPIPLMMMNKTNGAREFEIGQIASILSALVIIAMHSEVMGPILSPNWPNPILPKAEDRLNSASNVEPVPVEIPREAAYSGMKKGGTSKGNVAIPEPKKRRMNFGSVKRDLSRSV